MNPNDITLWALAIAVVSLVALVVYGVILAFIDKVRERRKIGRRRKIERALAARRTSRN